MALQAGVGFADGGDSYIVGVNAAQQALQKLGGEPQLAIVMASSTYNQEEMLRGVRSVTKDAVLVGSSTAGEITTEGPLNRRSVAVMLLRADDVKFYAAVGEDVAKGAREAGKRAAESVKAQASEDLKTFMMFPDVLVGNGADIVRGVLDALGQHFPVVGGASGDDFKFVKTYQYLNDKVYSGAVVGLGMTGNVKIGIGVKHGWIPIGPSQKVTKSEGSVLKELDGRPAISIYEDYFGKEEAKQLKGESLAKLAIMYPLGMRLEDRDEMLLRAPLIASEDGSLTCAAEIPEGAEIQLMVGSREEAVRMASEAAQDAVRSLDDTVPKAVVIFNCIARSKLFGDQSGSEITAIQKEIGSQVPLIGFYTYGEQAPLGGEVRNIERCNPAFHNQTVVICVFG